MPTPPDNRGKTYNKKKLKGLEDRQLLFLGYYLDPKSDTFSNAYQSSIKAGFSETYATNMKSREPKWLLETVKDKDLLAKAERNLGQLLDQDKNLNVRATITMFVAERLGKGKYIKKEKVEHSGNLGVIVLPHRDNVEKNGDKESEDTLETDTETK